MTTGFARCSHWLLSAALALVPGSAAADEPTELTDLMARGKLAADLGRHDEAVRSFEAVAEAAGASGVLRAEALVRLGSARRAAGDPEAALESFERAWEGHARQDPDLLALLVQAVGGALPGADRWAQIWREVRLVADRSDPKRPAMAVVWPGVPRAPRHYTGQAITLDLRATALGEVFRALADITGLNVVVFPGVAGEATMRVALEPWDQVLERLLAPHGLVHRWEGNVVFIAPPEHLGPAFQSRGRPIDLDLKDQDLLQALTEIARHGSASVAADPALGGRVTLKLNRVPWDQAFDIVVRVHGLAWTRDGDVIRVGPRTKVKG